MSLKWTMALLRMFGIAACVACVITSHLDAQQLRGRVIDASRNEAIPGAILQFRDAAGTTTTAMSNSSGAFAVVLAAGNYRVRAIAVGFTPKIDSIVIAPSGLDGVHDIVLQRIAVDVPALVAHGRRRSCGRATLDDRTFGALLDAVHNSFDVIEATLQSRQVGFEVAVVTSRTLFQSPDNTVTADTVRRTFVRWPVQSLDPDTLRQFGFMRAVKAPGGPRLMYYGPDARVLFANWFLESHCFAIDRRHRGSDSLVIRFEPVRRGQNVDITGVLTVDANSFSLLNFSFRHVNLPPWMGEESAGGEMEFARLRSGAWFARGWALWAPIEGIAADGSTRAGGVAEVQGWVARTRAADH